MNLLRTVLLIGLVSVGAWSMDKAVASPFDYTWQELAPGVWAALRQDPFALPQEGNAVLVVTDRGVVIFDAGGSPLMGEAIVAKVRSLTGQPVTHVVISHWHGDHMRGLQAIQSAFPQVQILAHPHTRDFIVATQGRWLKRRVSMVPNIRKAVDAALSRNQDLSGRPLIKEERAWLEKGLATIDLLDRENNRTEYVVPTATFADRLTLYLGGREIQLLRLGNAHTAGDVILWLPQERIVATGDVVTAPIPLMPSPYTNDYVGVLHEIEALGYKTLVPGHGPVEHDSQYIDLLADTFQTVSAQMNALVAQGLSKEAAVEKIDFSKVEPRFTHGDPFLANRFRDYVSRFALPEAAWSVATGKAPDEAF